MSRTAQTIILSPEEQTALETWAHGRSLPARLVQRAQIIRMAAGGALNQDIARELRISRPTVQLWRQRFLALRVPGLEKDAPRPGRIPKISPRKIKAVIEATLHTTPPNATHWSTRTMAKAQNLSEATIRRIWKQHNLKPHLVNAFKLSRDTHFVEKLCDIVGLYLNPPDKSLVLCLDEKSQIQALDRTQPGLPLKKGRCGTMTHDYKRHGTTSLFAALNVLEGTVIGTCYPRHRHQEFLKFLRQVDRETPRGLDLHLILDNYGTHSHPDVEDWFEKHPRFHLHFTPTSSSWLNLIERWFGELTRKQIRRGIFRSVPDLIAAIQKYIRINNQQPKPFVWTKKVNQILEKIGHCKAVIETLH
jgi:transposase